MVSDQPIVLEPLPHGPLNVIDVQTAIEAYTPMYALFLPREDSCVPQTHCNWMKWWRSISPKFWARLSPGLMKNGHPLVPLSTLQAGYRLMMHGLDVGGCMAGCASSSAASRPASPSIPATPQRPA